MKPLIFAASDIHYFLDHGLAFCKSLKATGHAGLITIFGAAAESEVQNLNGKLDEVFKKLPDNIQITFTDISSVIESCRIEDPRALFASIRFLLLPDLLQIKPESILLLDMDALVRKPIELPEGNDLGLYLHDSTHLAGNDYERAGMRLAAGCMLVTPQAQEFTQVVANYIRSHPIKWFCDQVALFDVYEQYKDSLVITQLPDELMDCDFTDSSWVWQGRGPRKTSDKKYLQEKERILALDFTS